MAMEQPKWGVCALSVVPMRTDASDASEQCSQLLFGECYEVKEVRARWLRIQCAADGYQGWIDRKQHTETAKDSMPSAGASRVLDLVGVAQRESDGLSAPILMGSVLNGYNGGSFMVGNQRFLFDGLATEQGQKPSPAAALSLALQWLNAPYQWGGRSPFGVDCSGLVQVCYQLAGLQLPRDAHQQAQCGVGLSFIEEAQPGDLAFFDNDEGRIIHVGFVMADNRIVHASGRVRIDRIDHQGIYNAEKRDYTHRLRMIKRVC